MKTHIIIEFFTFCGFEISSKTTPFAITLILLAIKSQNPLE
jgi:hypothetical protein